RGLGPAAARTSAILRSIRLGSKANSRFACGVATMSVVPDSAARRNIATAISIFSAPSSRPGRMWEWMSTSPFIVLHTATSGYNSGAMWIRKGKRDHLKGVDSPVPTQLVSNEEYIPRRQTQKQKEVEYWTGQIAEQNSKRLGMDRRKFMTTPMGLAACFLA